MIGSTIAHYRITAKLGEGGMGVVYRATDTKLNRDVAIKLLPDTFGGNPARLARFTREAQVLASLNHPNIAAVYGVEDRAIVMELVEGTTLAERIERGALHLEEALAVARQIAEALEAAHEKGIIHRDLKPANVKVTPDGKVKVLDFGLSKLADAEDSAVDPASAPTVVKANSPTIAGMIMGTPGYMAPEQARGQRVDKRADIWAFGVVLFEMLSGRKLFGGSETVMDSLAAVMTRDPDWSLLPAGTPASIRRLLRRALERDRRKRLPDIVDARLEIDAAGEIVLDPVRRPGKLAPVILAGAFALAAAVALWAPWRQPPEPAKPVQFQITPATGVVGTFALSPDGARLAYWGSGTDGRMRLWIRSMDTLESRVLAITESEPNETFLFWSPDSRFIAFNAREKLKKVDVAGGPPQTVCEVCPGVVGGSWNRDNVILFGTSITSEFKNGSGIQRVSADNGTPSPATALNAVRKDLNHQFPVFLPDGRHFLYRVQSAVPENSGIYIGSLDSVATRKDSKRLVATSFGASFVPSAYAGAGAILFHRDETLLAQPFDLRSLRTTGEAVPIAEQAGSFRRFASFTSSDNGTLAYRSATGSRQLSWFDRQGTSLGFVGDRHNYTYLMRLSPDGTRVATTRTAGANPDIWLSSFSNESELRFTFRPGQDSHPVWSPDGNRIAFASNRNGNFDLYERASGAGGEEELLYRTDHTKFATDWSLDGRFLLYHEFDPKTRRDLWVLPMDSPPGDRKPVPYLRTEFTEMYARFSPDGNWVTYQSDESGKLEIYVRPFEAARAGGGTWKVSQGGGILPAWRRDGKELYYLTEDGKVMAVSVTTSGGGLQFATPVVLFKGPHNPEGWDVSADGKRFLLPVPASESQVPFTVVLNTMSLQKR